MSTRADDRRRGQMKSGLVAAAVLLLWVVPALAQGRPSRADEDILLEGVQLRPGVSADIHVRLFVNEVQPCQGRTMLAVPGFAHTAATLGPLAEALFARSPAGLHACRIAALDFPGHGGSSLPVGLPFGFLTLEDHVAVVLASLQRLPALGVRPDSVVAHSQGGLLVQLAQQALGDRGTSLREAFNVRDVVLLASVPPGQVPWVFADSGVALAVLASFLASNAALGPHVAIPDPAWPVLFFSNLSFAIAPGAPAPEDVARFNAPEPLVSGLELIGALELLGLPPTPRPSVDAGIFGDGSKTTLRVVTFEQDQLIRPDENAALYAYLTGDDTGAGVVVVSGEFAVHDMHVSDPDGLLDAIAGRILLR